MKNFRLVPILIIILIFTLSCQSKKEASIILSESEEMENSLLDKYIPVKLTSDLSHLSQNQREMIKVLIEASEIMDDIFWLEAYGDKNALLSSIQDEDKKKFVEINYGPWDRLKDNSPFIDKYGEKPLGANYYPTDMTKKEFEASTIENKKSQYTVIERDKDGKLIAIPYYIKFKNQVNRASQLLMKAADMAEDKGFKNYLELRATALLNDEYQKSDLAWMDMKTNAIDVVIGPIENYEDKLYNYKTAHEAYVLIKDMAWSKKLAKFVKFLPELQAGLPVEEKYKKVMPGSQADLNAYDVIYYAGDCNAGSKTIAINLPNDEEVQLQKGSRRLQLKNAMRAKFDKILIPIADELIDPSQRQHITFDAFFANTMFHEVAHGLGIKKTLDGKGTVRQALLEHASALEEGKADVLGLYMITQLQAKGEIDGNIKDYYTTFMAGIFRSVRFGAASAHGTANMIRFNFFNEFGAFTRDETTGRYLVNYNKMEEAMNALSAQILTLQGDGNYASVAELVRTKGKIGEQLKLDLDRLNEANIPVDVVFEQGTKILGL